MTLPFPTLFVGGSGIAEFQGAAQWFAERGALLVSNVRAAIDEIQNGLNPALIVLAHPWPGSLLAGDIEQLQTAVPLARIIRFQGSWLEGEKRTGRPVPATRRMYWHHWPARLAREVELISRGDSSFWSQPITANDDDRLLANLPRYMSPPESTTTKLIAIVARHRETAESLANLCRQRGWQTMQLQNVSADTPLTVDAVLYDVEQEPPKAAHIQALKTAAGNSPLIALVGFPRLHEVQQLQTIGFATVVSKPFLADDLIWQIENLVTKNKQMVLAANERG